MNTITRRSFVKRTGAVGGGLMAAGPLGALASRAEGQVGTSGYGPLVDKGDIWLPPRFEYEVISRQGDLMSDGQPTPGIFDGMGSYRGPNGTTILIRNHENRERDGEQRVITSPSLEYNPAAAAGNTKLRVRRRGTTYEVVEAFGILGGTSTNCAGGLRSPNIWITCEEVVKRLDGKKHGYVFEIDARAEGPVAAVPVAQAGRRAHEAALERSGIIYMTEDRSLESDAVLGTIGACFYRYMPGNLRRGRALADTTGPLEALKIRGEFHANMDTGRALGQPYPVEWVPVPEPDHEDDTDNRRDRVAGFTPNRIQAQDAGAAYFDRQEGMWAGPGGSKIYFDCTTGGAQNLGQVWEYDPGRETVTLIYESTDAALLENPDNVVTVPQTGDIFLCEDSDGDQHVRGVTRDGEIYDFARSGANPTEFCGACFDPDGRTLYLNQQGDRGSLPNGPENGQAVTYAIHGPFGRRAQ
jgi:secreted PhoX family phosphatase